MNKEQNKFIIQNVVFHTTERITGILKSVSKKLPDFVYVCIQICILYIIQICMYVYIMYDKYMCLLAYHFTVKNNFRFLRYKHFIVSVPFSRTLLDFKS